MQLIFEGILFGLTLTILLGPIFIALTETGIQKGLRAGLTVGLGIWFSDFLIISTCYLFIHSVRDFITDLQFQFWLGMAGGIVLICFGLVAYFKRIEFNTKNASFKAKHYLGFFVKGFLVNTVNPFTFIFWITVITTYVVARFLNQIEAVLFLGSIMATVIITDSLKVVLAKWLRTRMNETHIQWFTKIAGIGLMIFGIVLMIRVI